VKRSNKKRKEIFCAIGHGTFALNLVRPAVGKVPGDNAHPDEPDRNLAEEPLLYIQASVDMRVKVSSMDSRYLSSILHQFFRVVSNFLASIRIVTFTAKQMAKELFRRIAI